MRTRVAVLTGIAACLMAAGCGSLSARTAITSDSARHGPVGRSSGTPGPAQNRRLARVEAQRLLSLTRVPPGAAKLGSAPASLPGPAMGKPAVGSLIDSVGVWRVPMAMTQTLAWLRAHPPEGLNLGGSMRGWNRGGLVTMSGYSYRGPASTAWQSADLDVSVAPSGSGATVIRADGVVVWLDSDPLRDTAPGKRIHVSVAGGCPASDLRVVGVTNNGTDLGQQLLPSANPTAGLECRYDGGNGRPWRLREQTRLDGAAARRVAGSMSRLPLSHTVGGAVFCPMDDGAAKVIALSYPGRADVDLWVRLNGCGGVSNGQIIASTL